MKRSFTWSTASFFAFLCILFIPFPFYLTRIQLRITESLFGPLTGFVSKNIFGQPLADTHVHSDTRAMYVLVLILFILSIAVSVILQQLKSWERYRNSVLKIIYLLVCYYLALQLLKYGLDKIFKNQFFLPEPNTLYTPMGKISRDLLYWSAMGTSHFYNVFLGLVEMIAALLILIRRTRLAGLLISFFIMINVVAVNFGFDISVKVFSLLLFFLTIYVLVPYLSRMYQFFFTRRLIEVKQPLNNTILLKNRFVAASLKWFAFGIIFLESFYPFIRSGNFNDDLAPRSPGHGAYEVRQFISGPDTLEPADFPVKRFFIHRDSYMIFQDQQDEMNDYKLVYDKKDSGYALVDYQMRKVPIQLIYQEKDSILTLRYNKGEQLQLLTGKAIDWRKMPALKKEFHWIVD